MYVFALMVAMLLLSALSGGATTARVIKTETGNCTGSNTTFRKREHVDLNGDNKADYIVTTWCNGKVNVNKPIIASGNWPSDWTSQLDYHIVASNGAHHYRFTYKDVVSNVSLGTETVDSTNPDVATMVFYSFVMSTPRVTDPDNQEPYGFVELVSGTFKEPSVQSLHFESYDSGNHIITVNLVDHANNSSYYPIDVAVDGPGTIVVPIHVPKGYRVAGFNIHRPGPQDSRTWIPAPKE